MRPSERLPRTVSDELTQPEVSPATLQDIDWARLEQLVTDLWQEMGYESIARDPEVYGPQDNGIDLVARRRGPGGRRVAIQVKAYRNSVGGPHVQQYFGIKEQVHADRSLIVTSGEFSGTAVEIAEKLGVELINGEQLRSLIETRASLGFYSEYHEALGVEPEAIQQTAKQHATPLNRLTMAVYSGVGRAQERLGRLLHTSGRCLRSTATFLRRKTLWLRNGDPMLSEERRKQDDSGAANPPRRKTATLLENRGNQLMTRGMDRQRPPVVQWQHDVGPVLPEAGVDPGLRPASVVTLRRQLLVPVLGVLLFLLAIGTELFFEISRSVPVTLALVGFGLCATGILASTTRHSHSFFDLVRFAYLVPVSVPIAAWTTTGPPADTAEFGTLGVLGVAGVAAFCLHTAVSARRQHRSYKQSEFPASFVPHHRETTSFGCFGLMVLLVGGVGYHTGGLSLSVPTLSGTTAGVSVDPRLVAVSGVLAVSIAAVVYLWDGGLLGIVSGAVLVSGGLALAGVFELWQLGSGVTVGVFASLVALCLLTGFAVLSQLKHRSLQLRTVLLGLVFLFLLQQAMFGGGLLGALLFSTPRLTPGQLLIVTLLLGAALFLTTLWLERRAMTTTVPE